MKKKVICLLTSLVMVVGLIGVVPVVSAGAAVYGDYEYEFLLDGTVEITGYNGSAYSLAIPSVLGGNKVTSIGDEAFYYCTTLKNITIPSSIKSIGNDAFNWCANLKNIVIPNSVICIGDKAFAYCKSLESITISNSVTSIGDSAFLYCTSLKNIVIPNSVKSIGGSILNCCKSLTSVVLGNGITSIGDSAFYNCASLTSVKISNSVTSIGDEAFQSCGKLKSIIIPSSVKSIDDRAFAFCYKLKSITIPDSVTSIGYNAFVRCTDLTITCKKGSYAEKYAIENNIKYALITNIGTVSGFKTSAISSTAVKLAWNKVSGAQGYIVYKYDNAKKTWVRVAKTKTTANTYTVSKLSSGTSYKFAVKAYKTVNGKEVTSSSFPTVTAITKLPTVVNGTTTVGKNSIKLTWKKTTGAAGYIVYKYDNSKKTWVRVAKTSSLNYTVKNLKANTSYKFTVKAYKYVSGKEITSVSFTPISVKTKK